MDEQTKRAIHRTKGISLRGCNKRNLYRFLIKKKKEIMLEEYCFRLGFCQNMGIESTRDLYKLQDRDVVEKHRLVHATFHHQKKGFC